MTKQDTLFYIPPFEKDMVFTPTTIAKDIITWIKPTGICLDPCKGDGAFFNNFPGSRDWCEITEGKDFFDYHKRVDYIIGNPPYSIFEDFLQHSFELSENVVYIVPTNKIFQRRVIMNKIVGWGGLFGLRLYGAGIKVGFPFGFSVGTFHFKKMYNGGTHLSYYWRRRYDVQQ